MENLFDDSNTECDDYYVDIALRLTYGIPSTLQYDLMLDEDYEVDCMGVDFTVEADASELSPSSSYTEQLICGNRQSTGANEMHVAVFRYDVEAVQTLLRYKPVSHWDQPDHFQNTPLLLASKLGFVNLSRLLIAEGFSCECSSSDGDFEYHLMDEAVLTGSVLLVQDIYVALQKLSWRSWLDKKSTLLDCLERIPDFYVELKWNFSGFGPMGGVVKMFAPDDTYRIWKKGSWLRLDSTIAGFNRNFSAKRGQLSTIFRGRRGSVQLGSGEVPLMGGDMENGEEEGDLLHVDRSDMTFQRVLKKLQRPREDDLARAADRLIRAKEKHNMVNAFDLDASHWHIRALKDMRGKVKKVRVDDGEYEKWEAKGEVQVRIDAKRDNSSLINLTEDEYFLRTPASASGRADVIAEEAETDCEQLATKRGSTPIGGGDKRVKSKSRTRTLKKHINIGLLMTNTSPISMRELMPILEVFSWRNEFIAKLRSIFGGKEVQVPDGSFPFRTQIPLLVGVSAVATFGRVERIDSGSGCGCIDDNIFSVPASEFHETVDTVVDTHP